MIKEIKGFWIECLSNKHFLFFDKRKIKKEKIFTSYMYLINNNLDNKQIQYIIE